MQRTIIKETRAALRSACSPEMRIILLRNEPPPETLAPILWTKASDEGLLIKNNLKETLNPNNRAITPTIILPD